MKNKMIKLLFIFMLAGSMLAGCGGNVTGTDENTNNGIDNTPTPEPTPTQNLCLLIQ